MKSSRVVSLGKKVTVSWTKFRTAMRIGWRVMPVSLVHNSDEMKLPAAGANAVMIELNAVLVALTANEPLVLTLEDGSLLPSGPFEGEHPTLQTGLRAWVERQTHHPLGYVEQLYTFADRNRTERDRSGRVVSISYLGLTRERLSKGPRDPEWRNWYRYFPWEDWRAGPPPLLAKEILPRLRKWSDQGAEPALKRDRRARIAINFGDGKTAWNGDPVLQRYELLYDGALVCGADSSTPATQPLP